MAIVFRDAGAVVTCSALCERRRCFTLRKECTLESLRQGRLLKKSVLAVVLKGRTFRCAVKLFVISSGLQPARGLLF
jgi:hypothetical protein